MLPYLRHRPPHLLAASRVLQDLKGFVRVSADTLIHKSQKDLWALKKEGDGHFYIERLFDDSGEPIKG